MQTASFSAPRPGRNIDKKAPPLWLVTNGDITVGPVTTNLLVRGVLHGRVPNDCLVRQPGWTAWRNVERIREITALRRAQEFDENIRIEKARWTTPAPIPRPFARLERQLLRAQDPGAVLLDCLMETMEVTGAYVGAVHRRRRPAAGLVTSCVSGPGLDRQLGQVVSLDDPAIVLAACGETLCEVPLTASASGIVRDRLGGFPACSGIAMVPVQCAGRLYAVMELGRPDHAFREGDFARLQAIAGLAIERLSVVRNRQ
jgi:hypothetical protein